MSEDRAFWDGVIRAAGAEPREARLIRGISGLEHPVAGVGVDEDGRRLVVISTAPEARSAAMAQADIQATMQNVQVVVARPVVVDMAAFAKELGAALGRPEIGSEDFARIPTTRDGLTPEEINQQMQERMRPYLENVSPSHPRGNFEHRSSCHRRAGRDHASHGAIAPGEAHLYGRGGRRWRGAI
jgi:hypothetical protein